MNTTACLDRPDPMLQAGATRQAENTDEELMGRFQADGDREAFETLVHRYERELFHYLRRYLHDSEGAEDVFQATFLRIHLKKDAFEPGRRFRPWLYTVATNLAIDARRRDRRHRMATLDSRGPDDGGRPLGETIAAASDDGQEKVDSAETLDWVRAAVDHLAAPQRQLVQLIYHEGLKYREVASLLGIPLGTVKSRMHAAIVAIAREPRRMIQSPR